ncbi:MAG: glycosyltransferase family 2 protein [Bacteroidetes bacterium]|nr:glycosyltransferase family 2 protein [Bacteroidota bacterium]MCB0844570.1 glycosyltransferase family 2 protein [Bacteroidota bacterium]MCB0852947.1 glycosyltransferase family 2 protein [Bacteroidota bacterium]
MLVSVIIPTYKRTTYLKIALDSVLKQTYGNFEILVVNDFPPMEEEIDQLVAEFNDSRIKLIHHEENGGESASRNTALTYVKGEIVALLDDDDIWEPTFLEKHVAKHQERPEVGFVYCGYVRFWDDDVLGKQVRPAVPSPDDMYTAMLTGKFVMASSSLISIKKECFDECGNFDRNLPSFADWDMWVRIAQKYPFAHVEEPLTLYRHHLGVRGSTDIEKRLRGIEVISQKWKHVEAFSGYRRKLKVRAYFNEIRNEVMRGRRGNGFRLLMDCVKRCGSEIPPNFKPFMKAVFVLMFGKVYLAGHRKVYS